MNFSLIVPTFNEVRLGFLRRNLQEHSGNPDTEVICVDGGSTDATAALARAHTARWVDVPGSNRAQRLNQGIRESRGHWIVFVHPRSFLPRVAVDELTSPAAAGTPWGAWTHTFDHSHLVLRLTSWYSNYVRGDLRSIFYLDHCLFVRQDVARAFGSALFPEIPIFEDTEASFRLKEVARGVRLPQRVTTSSTRYLDNGVLRQALRNQWAKARYLVGSDLQCLNKAYEGRAPLNGVIS